MLGDGTVHPKTGEAPKSGKCTGYGCSEGKGEGLNNGHRPPAALVIGRGACAKNSGLCNKYQHVLSRCKAKWRTTTACIAQAVECVWRQGLRSRATQREG